MNALISALMSAPLSGWSCQGHVVPIADDNQSGRSKRENFCAFEPQYRVLSFGSHMKHPRSGRACEIQYAQEQGKTGKSLVQSGSGPGNAEDRMVLSDAMRLPASLHCVLKSALSQRWRARKEGVGITERIIPNRTIKTGLKWVIVKKSKDTCPRVPASAINKPGQVTAVPDAVVEHGRARWVTPRGPIRLGGGSIWKRDIPYGNPTITNPSHGGAAARWRLSGSNPDSRGENGANATDENSNPVGRSGQLSHSPHLRACDSRIRGELSRSRRSRAGRDLGNASWSVSGFRAGSSRIDGGSAPILPSGLIPDTTIACS